MARINTNSARIVVEMNGSFHEIVNLRKEIYIERPEGRELPTCTMVVYNMTPANVTRLREVSGRVVVYATVDDVEYTMFVGNTASVVAEYDGADLATEIMLVDAKNSMQTKVALSYPAGANIGQIIRDVSGQAGIQSVSIAAPFDGQTLSSAYAYSGTARRALDQLTNRHNGLWRVTDGRLSAGTKESLSKPTSMRYTASSGLIDSPRMTDEGLELSVVLSPMITNGSIIKVESVFVDSWCRVESHTHSFGPLDDVWVTTIVCKEVE